MPRINAETLSLDGICALTGMPFGSLIPIGTAVGECNSLTGLTNIPKGKTGIYTVWVSLGDRPPILVYGGKCAGKRDGIRHRIYVHYNKIQNAISPSGCYLVDAELKAHSQTHSFSVAYAEYAAEELDAKERHILGLVDFIANDALNGERRLKDLHAFFAPGTAADTVPAPSTSAPVCTDARVADLLARLAALEAENAAFRAREARRRAVREEIDAKTAQLIHLRLAPALFSTMITALEAEVAALHAEKATLDV